MNQNKSNVPVSVAEEPDELSYYRLTLLSFLRESHPDLADDGKHSINSPFHSKKCDITFVIKVKKLNCYVTSMDHGRF